MNKLDRVVARLQLKIFAETYKNVNSRKAEDYQEAIIAINEEYSERYAHMPIMLCEANLAREFPLRSS